MVFNTSCASASLLSIVSAITDGSQTQGFVLDCQKESKTMNFAPHGFTVVGGGARLAAPGRPERARKRARRHGRSMGRSRH